MVDEPCESSDRGAAHRPRPRVSQRAHGKRDLHTVDHDERIEWTAGYFQETREHHHIEQERGAGRRA